MSTYPVAACVFYMHCLTQSCITSLGSGGYYYLHVIAEETKSLRRLYVTHTSNRLVRG